MQANKKELYGGAFSIDSFPANLRDISDKVPIQDNQEVFSDVAEDNNASGNQLIIEILDATDKTDSPADFHFKTLAEEQEANDVTIVSSLQKQLADLPKIKINGAPATAYLLKCTMMVQPVKRKFPTPAQ